MDLVGRDRLVLVDGDTIFGVATGSGPTASPLEFHAILSAAADCFSRAVVHAARDLVVDARYLHLPVANDAPTRRVRLAVPVPPIRLGRVPQAGSS